MTEQNEQRNFADYLPNYYNEEPDPFDYRVGFGRRLGAYLIDYMIITLLFTITLFASGQMSLLMDSSMLLRQSFDTSMIEELMETIMPISILINVLYFSSEIFFGVSLGKLMLGLRIGDADRYPAPITKLLTRYILKNISSVFGLIGLIFTFSFFDYFADMFQFIIYFGFFLTLAARKQGIHDMLSATAVYYTNEIIYENKEQ